MSENASPDNLTKTPNPQLLARLYVQENKSFLESAVQAGYSAKYASRGIAALSARSAPIREALRTESDRMISLQRLKPLAVRRLHDEIVNPKSPLGIKAIELAGRFKETDWFVRSSDTLNIGVFTAVADASQDADTGEYEDKS